MYEIFVHVPESHLEAVKKAMFEAGGGALGNYSSCSWQVLGEGQFCPEAGSDPYLGKRGMIEKVKEYRLHMVCQKGSIGSVISALKKVHPYETPAYGVIKLESF
jgi:structural toxin protein (hemagglutinin/hemolysin) RtxA